MSLNDLLFGSSKDINSGGYGCCGMESKEVPAEMMRGMTEKEMIEHNTRLYNIFRGRGNEQNNQKE